MSDRELLELAARAAGLTIVRWVGDVPYIYFDRLRPWNPLSSMDQAKTLRHSLRLTVGKPRELEPVSGSYRTAYRRAIVRAAAAIGKGGE